MRRQWLSTRSSSRRSTSTSARAAAPASSSPTGSRRSATATRSSSSRAGLRSNAAPTTSSWPSAASTRNWPPSDAGAPRRRQLDRGARVSLTLAIEPAARRPVPANRPLPLDDPSVAWIVLQGRVQIFARRRDVEAAARESLFTIEAGELILPPPRGAALGLLAVGLEDDTVLGALRLADLEAAVATDG